MKLVFRLLMYLPNTKKIMLSFIIYTSIRRMASVKFDCLNVHKGKRYVYTHCSYMMINLNEELAC